MADEKPKTITATIKAATQCTNCQRGIAIGESVTTPSEDELNRGNVLCSNCAPPSRSSKAITAPPADELEPAPKPATFTATKKK